MNISSYLNISQYTKDICQCHNEEALHRSIRNQFWDVLVRSHHEEDLIFTVIAYVSIVCGNHLFFSICNILVVHLQCKKEY